MDTRIANTWDSFDSKLKGISSKFDEFFKSTKKNQVEDESYNEEFNKLKHEDSIRD